MPFPAGFTYTPEVGRPLDRARLRLGDVTGAGVYLSDYEWLSLLGQYPEPEAQAQGAVALGTRYLRKAESYAEGDVSKSFKGRAQAFFDLAAQIRASAVAPGGVSRAGGAVTTMAGPNLCRYRVF